MFSEIDSFEEDTPEYGFVYHLTDIDVDPEVNAVTLESDENFLQDHPYEKSWDFDRIIVDISKDHLITAIEILNATEVFHSSMEELQSVINFTVFINPNEIRIALYLKNKNVRIILALPEHDCE